MSPKLRSRKTQASNFAAVIRVVKQRFSTNNDRHAMLFPYHLVGEKRCVMTVLTALKETTKTSDPPTLKKIQIRSSSTMFYVHTMLDLARMVIVIFLLRFITVVSIENLPSFPSPPLHPLLLFQHNSYSLGCIFISPLASSEFDSKMGLARQG